MRKPRQLTPGGTYHVFARINSREHRLKMRSCKMLFLEVLFELQAELLFKIEQFAIMNNHFHLIIKTLDLELPTIMKRLLMTVAIRYNKRHRRSGHLWGDRYKSEILWTKLDFEQCFNYISNNPVAAHLVKRPIEWEWSGIAWYRSAFPLMNTWISEWVHELYRHALQDEPDPVHKGPAMQFYQKQ